ncbi:MAG TPA: apolipoprotein N-acyltransferase [Spirochaetota bacterium]|nr:apolipoprotein N-acyltransferase [Spirochaetota bacterium]
MINIKKTFNNIVSNNIFYYTLLVLFGALWGIGQHPNFFFIRFFGLIPFLYVVFKRKSYILDTLIFGWLAYILNFYWLFITFFESGKLPIPVAIIIILVLCLYYGLQYPLISFIFKKFYSFNKKILFYSFPIVFVTIDFLFPKLFRHTIGDSQIGFFPFIQIIDITGMTGVILIFLFFNLGIYKLLNNYFTKKKITLLHFLFVVPLLLALTYGFFRIEYLNKEIKKLPTTYAAMIQGNVTGKQKMDDNYFYTNIDRYNRLTGESFNGTPPEFVIWPESVFNRAYHGDPEFLQQFIYENYPAPMIIGVVVWTSNEMTNSSLLIKDKQKIAQYDKQHLLMFGEYIPFEKTFPFLRVLSPFSNNVKPGKTTSIFQIGNVKASVSICFEDIFPELIKKNVNQGSNIMVNITNDSWYGKDLGPLHHSILARLRAIENRRSFYRCTATGLSTASDITGKVVTKSGMWREEVIKTRLPLYDKKTIYSYIGELFSYICIFVFIIIMLIMIRSYFIKIRIKKLKRNFDKKKLNSKKIKKIYLKELEKITKL